MTGRQAGRQIGLTHQEEKIQIINVKMCPRRHFSQEDYKWPGSRHDSLGIWETQIATTANS